MTISHRNPDGTMLPLGTLAELDLTAKLTPTPLEIARLVACGFTNLAIARRMHLTEHTIKTHIRHLLKAIGSQSRAHVVTWLYEAGYLVPRAAVPATLNELELTHSPMLNPPAATNPDPSLRRLRNQLLAARADIDHALTRLGGLQSEFLPR